MVERSSPDIVDELREWSSDFIDRSPLLDRAAAEIERQAARIEDLEAAMKKADKYLDDMGYGEQTRAHSRPLRERQS